MAELLVFTAAFLVSVSLTGIIRRYALKSGLLDIPNIRSSHEQPTPRGGGLAIALTFVAVLLFLHTNVFIPDNVFYAFLVGIFLIAGVGFVDDLREVPVLIRVLVHLTATAIPLYLLGGLPTLQVATHSIDLGLAGNLFAVVFLVWLTNLFNFMDGIDGIAAVEAIFIAAAAIIIGGSATGKYLVLLEIGLVASCAGFLIWNWPPAKIFMGDVGSGFLGLVLGVLAIISAGLDVLPMWTWFILAGVFVSDATITVTRRMIQREKWYTAHRRHAYQRVARRFKSHQRVTLLVSAINIGWLLPLAWVSALRPNFGWWLLLLAWIPLFLLAYSLGAGLPDNE